MFLEDYAGGQIGERPGERAVRDDALREWAEKHYNRTHPNDSWADLVRRASFSKEDRRLMEDWLGAARRHLGE